MQNSQIFFLLPNCQSTTSYFVIQIQEKKEGKIISRHLYLDSLLIHFTELEQKMVRLLVEEEVKFLKSQGIFDNVDSIRLNEIHIEKSKTLYFLEMIAKLGNLYYKNEPLRIEKRASISYFLEGIEESFGGIKARGFFKKDKEIMAYSEIDFLFLSQPSFCIYKQVLYPVKADYPLKYIVEAVDFTQKQKEEFLEDKEAQFYPMLILKESLLCHSLPSLQPVLELKDKMGSFANLKIESKDASDQEKKEAYHYFEKDLIEVGYLLKPQGSSTYFCPLDKVIASLQFLIEMGWQVRDIYRRKVVLAVSEDVSISKMGSNIEVRGSIDFGSCKKEISEIVASCKKNERFINLSSSEVGLLSDSSTLKEVIEEFELDSKTVVKPLSSFVALREEKNHSLYKEKVDIDLNPLLDFLNSVNLKEEKDPDPSFIGSLRPYQRVGLNWLLFLKYAGFGGILADDMGLGKTVQIIAFLSHLKEKKPILIITPLSLRFNWQNELNTFLPSRTVRLYSKDLNLLEEDIILITHGQLKNCIDHIASLTFQAIIIDEAQVMKNPTTKIALAIFRLKGEVRVSLSGTPVENHLVELWSHFHFLQRDLFTNRDLFEKGALNEIPPQQLKKIAMQIKPFFLRRLKSEVAKDLPEKIEQTVWVEMDEAHKEVYQQTVAAYRGGFLQKIQKEGVKKHSLAILEAILRLRQVALCPRLCMDYHDDAIGYGSKWPLFVEDIKTLVEEKRKVLIFSQFTTLLSLLKKELDQSLIPYVYLDGTTKNREAVVSAFQTDEQIPLFLGSLKAASEGLNLTKADFVFLLDPWWNSAKENQAIDRAHRIGRKECVVAKRYITKDTIEEKMMQLKERKAKLFDTLFDLEESASSFSLDDIEFLFS